MKFQHKIIYTLLVFALIVGTTYIAKNSHKTVTLKISPATQQVISSPSAVIGKRTKTSGCAVNGALQDITCTPGAVFSAATKDQICVSGYASSVRNVTTAEKNQVYQEYGIQSHTTGQYEVDHLVSLELGGSNDIANLWPEAANPTPGFHQKDLVENYLHDQVCNDSITLGVAQEEIATNWLSVYNQIKH